MRKILGLMILLASLMLWGCGSQVVATVNGAQITSQELDKEWEAMKESMAQYSFEGEQAKEFEQMLRVNLLNQMIDQKLIMEEVENLELMPTDKEIQEEIKNMKESLGSDDKFKKALSAQGLNEPQLKDLIKQRLAVEKLYEKISSEVPQPTEDEIKTYYENNKESKFTDQEQRQVRHILIGTGDYSNGKNRTEMEAKVLALQISDKLKAGVDFAELAKQYSDDLGSKDNGGEYPPFSKGSDYVEKFEEAAFNLETDELTAEPVKTDFGYHVMRLDKIIPAKTYEFAEVKEDAIDTVHEEAVNAKLESFMQNLRDNAEIVNSLVEEVETDSNDDKSTEK